MSEKKNIETTRMVMENWNRYLSEGFMDKIKQHLRKPLSKGMQDRHKRYFGDKTSKQPPQPVPGEDDFDEKTVELGPEDIEQEEPDTVSGPLSNEEIEKMITDEFKSISTKAAFLIKNKLLYTLKDIEKRIDARTSGLDIGPGHRLNRAAINDKKQARELAKGMLTRLKTALTDIRNNPTGQNKDPGDLERAASVVNQRQLEETIDRVFSNFLNESLDLNFKKKIVIEVKKRK